MLNKINNNNTMHIAYSALQQLPQINKQHNKLHTIIHDHEPLLRYEAYQAACQKYSQEIKAIQKYMPGWMPAFNR